MVDISYNEQYAGFHDIDGRRVYVKTVDVATLPSLPKWTRFKHKHDICGIHKIVKVDSLAQYTDVRVAGVEDGAVSGPHFFNNLQLFTYADRSNIVYDVSGPWNDYATYTLRVTVYYTRSNDKPGEVN